LLALVGFVLNEIRKNFTPSLGKDHVRVLLKAQKSLFEKRLAELRWRLERFQPEVRSKLQEKLDSSREEIVNYYVPRVVTNPPDAFAGQLMSEKPTEEDARRWLGHQLDRVFPKAGQLIEKMELEQTYKDVTFETLEQAGFPFIHQGCLPRCRLGARLRGISGGRREEGIAVSVHAGLFRDVRTVARLLDDFQGH
jgi:hypothetical protein